MKEQQSEKQLEAIWVRPKRGALMADMGITKCYALMDINGGPLKTRKVGGMRLISVESIKALGSAPE